MFQKVQQENEMLRNGRRHASGSAGMAAQQVGQPMTNMLSPPQNMHHQSHAPGSGRVVSFAGHCKRVLYSLILQDLCTTEAAREG